MQGLAALADSLFTCAQGTEILRCPGNCALEELHLDLTRLLLATDGNLKKNLRVCRVHRVVSLAHDQSSTQHVEFCDSLEK